MAADVLVLRRTANRRVIFVLLLLLLAWSPRVPHVAGAEGGSQPPVRPIADVTMRKGLLSVRARAADLRQVLREASILANVPIAIDPGIQSTVTTTFVDFPLDKAVERLLSAAGEENLAMEFSRRPGTKEGEFVVEKITVVRGAPKRERSLKEIQADIDQIERERREYFADMDKGKGKIARALRKHLDPDTSPQERGKLRDFLRGTSIDDPEDKKLLKEALLDTRFKGSIVSDIQMALLHAMQDHPEESDKDYIVALLERRDNRVGWLYYAMLKVWDERYIPYLIENVINEQGYASIEVLERMHVKQAVPFLEVALKSKDPTRRIKARDALFVLTGKKYPISD